MPTPRTVTEPLSQYNFTELDFYHLEYDFNITSDKCRA